MPRPGAPTAFVLQGSPELKARLEAILNVFEPVAAQWADDATSNMRHKIRSPTGKMRSSLHGYYNNRDGWVEGDWRVTFIDKGTKDHGPKNFTRMKFGGNWYSFGQSAANPPPMTAGGRTIFAKKVRGQRKRPFIRSSASQALRDNPMGKVLVAQWNAAGRAGGGYVLGNKALAKRRTAARRRNRLP